MKLEIDKIYVDEWCQIRRFYKIVTENNNEYVAFRIIQDKHTHFRRMSMDYLIKNSLAHNNLVQVNNLKIKDLIENLILTWKLEQL